MPNDLSALILMHESLIGPVPDRWELTTLGPKCRAKYQVDTV